MGKKRIKIIGSPESAKKKKTASQKGREIIKTGKQSGRLTDMGAAAVAEAEKIKEKEEKLEKEVTKAKTKEGKPKAKKAPRKRGRRYLQARKLVNRNQVYPLSEAIKLVKKTSFSHFKGKVEVHLNVIGTDLKGEIQFPHPTGKSYQIRIADEKLIPQLEKGKIDFDLLLASPAMMPKLVKFAKLLGPKGLMPNPKAGTISEKPEKLAKEMAGKVPFKTESKAPLIHLVIGQVEDKEKPLEENFLAMIKAIGKRNIQKAVLTATMGPGIKVDLASL